MMCVCVWTELEREPKDVCMCLCVWPMGRAGAAGGDTAAQQRPSLENKRDER